MGSGYVKHVFGFLGTDIRAQDKEGMKQASREGAEAYEVVVVDCG